MRRKRSHADRWQGKHWAFRKHIKSLQAKFKRYPDIGESSAVNRCPDIDDNSGVNRADELKQT